MLYSKDDVLTAVRQELAEANRELGIADGFTDNDYQYLGVIAAAWERLLILQPNGSKPFVIGSLPLSEDDLKEEVKSLYVANYKDYALVNADESFRDGIALGCWGMNEKLKRQ